MRAGTWLPTEKAPFELVLHCWGIRVSHDAVGVSHEAVTTKQTFLFIEMINKAGNLRRGIAGIEPTPSKS
jgi:hypothetical protein